MNFTVLEIAGFDVNCYKREELRNNIHYNTYILIYMIHICYTMYNITFYECLPILY